MSQTTIGIDAGGTLTKIAYNKNGHIHFKKFPTKDMKSAIHLMQAELDGAGICLTGGKSHVLKQLIDRHVKEVVEFEATCRGAQYLLSKQNHSMDEPFILVNVGTGTSIHYVNGNEQKRLLGTGIGGGTLVGLAELLTGEKDFEQIARLAGEGDRAKLDLQVKDIYGDSQSPILGSLTASNFGKAADQDASKQDRIAAITGMVAETVTLLSTQAADCCEASSIIYIGSTFSNHNLLKETVETYTRLVEKKPVFLDNGEMSGAIGALLALS